MSLRKLVKGAWFVVSFVLVVIGLASLQSDTATWMRWLGEPDPRLAGFLAGFGSGVIVMYVLNSKDWFAVIGRALEAMGLVEPSPSLRNRNHTEVEKLYMDVRRVVEPETLNQSQPGNIAFMRSDARDRINLLRPALLRRQEEPPKSCDGVDESLREWFEYLRDLRERI